MACWSASGEMSKGMDGGALVGLSAVVTSFQYVASSLASACGISSAPVLDRS